MCKTNSIRIKGLVLWILLGSGSTISAQNPQAFLGSDAVAIQQMVALPEGGWILGGTFRGQWSLEDTTLISAGEEDLFLLRQPVFGPSDPLFFGGSRLEEKLGGMALGPQGDLFLTGSFWETATFGADTLRATGNPKALFLGRISKKGLPRWFRTLRGGRLKEIGNPSVLPNGDLITTGYFSDSLQVADTVLVSTAAETSSFLLCWSANGDLKWVRTWGGRGNIRALLVATHLNNTLYVAGYYDDLLQTADTLLTANTTDRDVFLLSATTDGHFRWVEKAGGVFDEEPTSLIVDEAGHPVLAGFLVGRMTINGKLDIESRDGNADFFVLRYRPDSRIHWAYALGGDQLQSATALTVRGRQLFIAGRFQSNLDIPPFSAQASGLFDAFLLTMDTSGTFLELQTFTANDLLLPQSVGVDDRDSLFMGGTYLGHPQFPGVDLPRRQIFSGFLVPLTDDPLTSLSRPTLRPAWTVYPNPARDHLYVRGVAAGKDLIIFDLAGRIWWQGQVVNGGIPISSIPPGTYFLSDRSGAFSPVPFIHLAR